MSRKGINDNTLQACKKVFKRMWSEHLESYKHILQILQNPSRMWQVHSICDILMVCVILHNMIIKDEQDAYLEPIYMPNQFVPMMQDLSFGGLVDGIQAIHGRSSCYVLRNDLIEHFWRLRDM